MSWNGSRFQSRLALSRGTMYSTYNFYVGHLPSLLHDSHYCTEASTMVVAGLPDPPYTGEWPACLQS
jgi:hypothetical protein